VPPSSPDQSAKRAVSVPHDRFGGAIISIGPHTDAVLDRFHLKDNLIPQLRLLSTAIRSSKWEAALRSTQWGLSYVQAANLSKAMIADISNEPLVRIKVRLKYSLIQDIDHHQTAKRHICFQVSCSRSSPAWRAWRQFWPYLCCDLGLVFPFLN
jgi:hypothetical protein